MNSSPAKRPPASKPQGVRQIMSNVHIWTGLLVGWILYAMFLTGTVSYFREELSSYMRPELQRITGQPAAQVAQNMLDTIVAQDPDSPLVLMSLPTSRNPLGSAFWRTPPGSDASRPAFDRAIFNPETGQKLTIRDTEGGDFFFAFHFNLHYMSPLWGRWIAGLSAMFMLIAIVSGVITHKKIFIDFFTFRWGKGQRSWLDAHNALSVFGLPFHFMITWSGLITLMLLYMPWGMQQLPNMLDRAAVNSEMRFFLPAGQPSGAPATLVPISDLVQQAEARWGKDSVGSVQVNLANDSNARVAVARQQAQRISITPQYLLFDGVSGELISAKESSGPAATTQGVLYGLHLGRFADIATRWFYFLVSLAGTAMVGTGLVLWTVKRRSKLADPGKPYFGFALVERLNIASIAGLSVAVTGFLWLNRLLPLDMAQRAVWEVHGFFIIWAGTLLWACLRPAKRAWQELLWLATALLAALPILNMFLTDRHLLASLQNGDWLFASFDLSLWVFAMLHAYMARRVTRHKPKGKNTAKAPPAKAAPKAKPGSAVPLSGTQGDAA
ncbi:PepSY domain-containing protein [Alcaligenes faecalis]|uniref:PepSY-associated TM helix domain-containing protein n=1 Tax=Alcaligenes faecalis TaxID=511 RepID=UPI001C8355A5|nr:PepSY-associated TM helix domain-containing protein [Alcaligenes faecalis]MBX6964187.1 PepSY domain-containing protein [Providencia rettgeri]MBX7029436.1 PepSY domain-containing protein [Alcaligenes faecalis]